MTKRALRAATLVAAGAGLYAVFRGVSAARLIQVLRTTAVEPLALWVTLLLGTGFLLRALRFRTVLGKAGVTLPGFVATALLSQAANNVLPFRAGELVKTRDFVAAGQPVGRVLAAQATEKIVEGSTLVFICGPALSAAVGFGRPLQLLGAFLAALLPLQVWIARRFGIRPVQVACAFGWSLVADAIEIALVSATLRSLGLPSGLRTSTAVLGAVNLAIALPSVPGHAGVFEAGAALALIAMGVGREAALAFALLYRMVQWIPVTTIGAVIWALRARGRGRARPRES